jgi:hypothetical protein
MALLGEKCRDGGPGRTAADDDNIEGLIIKRSAVHKSIQKTQDVPRSVGWFILTATMTIVERCQAAPWRHNWFSCVYRRTNSGFRTTGKDAQMRDCAAQMRR